MIRKLTKSETEALLTELAENRSCGFNCQCVFCREFELGAQSGKHDTLIKVREAFEKMMEGLKC